MAKRRKRKNPTDNHPGLGAFLGSMVGVLPGALISAVGAKSVGSVVGEFGSIAGGSVGGFYGAASDRRTRGAVGGAIGGIFGPLGAALGGYIGGLKADKRRNPSMPVTLLATGGALVVGGAGAAGYLKWKAKRKGALPSGTLVPEGYEQVMCNPYKGHQICVYHYQEPLADRSGSFDAYKANVDGGAMLDYIGTEPDQAVYYAQQQVDAF